MTKTERHDLKIWLSVLISNSDVKTKPGELDQMADEGNLLSLSKATSPNDPKLIWVANHVWGLVR